MPKDPKPFLKVVDRGHARNGLPLRDVYLVEGGTGQETWLHHVGMTAALAAAVAGWFREQGVAVVEEARPAAVPADDPAAAKSKKSKVVGVTTEGVT